MDSRLNDVLNFKHLFKCFSHITGWDVNAGCEVNSAALGKGTFHEERTGAL